MTRLRTYSELCQNGSFEDRFRYLSLKGTVGESTFGSERYLNQRFYGSREWRQLRSHIIIRDQGCDLGVEGYEIHQRLYIHHLNPIRRDQIIHGDRDILDPEFLIATTHQTHNAIHYGDERQLPKQLVVRQPGDTKLW